MTSEFSDPESDLLQQMISRRDSKIGDRRSLVYNFAESRAEGHSYKLRALESLLDRGQVADLKSLPADYKRRSLPHLNQIFFGSTIMAIEETLISGAYSHYFYTTMIKDRLTGTAWTGAVVVGENKDLPVDPVRMKDMYNAAKEDPTLSVFFERSDNLMPREMYDLMRGLGIFIGVKLVALGDYKRKALTLVKTP